MGTVLISIRDYKDCNEAGNNMTKRTGQRKNDGYAKLTGQARIEFIRLNKQYREILKSI